MYTYTKVFEICVLIIFQLLFHQVIYSSSSSVNVTFCIYLREDLTPSTDLALFVIIIVPKFKYSPRI